MILPRRPALLVAALLLPACEGAAVGPTIHLALPSAPAPAAPPPAPPPSTAPTASAAPTAPAPTLWAEPTRSPRLAPPAQPADAPLHAICGDNDRALQRAAEIELARVTSSDQLLPSDELAFTLRALGEPHVWARAWTASGHDEEEMTQRLTHFATDGWNSAAGVRRCGIARVPGAPIIAVVAVDALADLEPVPVTVKVGETVHVRGSLLVPVTGVTATVLGPHGAPRQAPVVTTGSAISLSFSPDQPGAWTLQIRAILHGGARPLLEAVVHAGTPPPERYVVTSAPGEDAGAGIADPVEALARMINAARTREGSPPLQRDAMLDAVARAHTEQMVRVHRVAHDVGSGEPSARLAGARVRFVFSGEVVARAGDVAAVHRAIWGSPSERGSLLDARARHLGLGVVVDEAGAWVTELFTE